MASLTSLWLDGNQLNGTPTHAVAPLQPADCQLVIPPSSSTHHSFRLPEHGVAADRLPALSGQKCKRDNSCTKCSLRVRVGV